MDIESDSTFLTAFQPNMGAPKNYGRFYRKWKRNNFKSIQEGREVGEYVDYILIISPGQIKSEVHRQVVEADKTNFMTEWEAYTRGREQVSSGTPIELLPGLDQARADAFKVHYVMTIEQLAELSDLTAQKTGIGSLDLRDRARKYLASRGADKRALEDAQAQIIDLTAKLAAMQAQLSAVLTAQNSATEALKDKRKRA